MKKYHIYSAIVAALFVASSLFAADIDNRAGTTGYSWKDASRTFVLENTLDLSANTALTNQVYNLIQITAPAFVQAVYWSVTEAAGASTLFEIGDGSDTDGFVASTSLTNVTSGFSLPSYSSNGSNTVGYSSGKYYSANDTIDLKSVGNIPTDGTIVVKVIVVNLED